MKILFINPIVYTSETKKVKKVESIKDSMSYGLCRAFKEQGHDVILYASVSYKPLCNEEYEFDVVFDENKFEKIFQPHRIPYLKNLKKYIKANQFDLIICSEAFSIATFITIRNSRSKVVVWQELAKHNNMLKKIPSKIWYSIIVKHLYKNTLVIPRSSDARMFIERYMKNVSNEIIDHGVDISKFMPSKKKRQFVIVSQLIDRKQIDKSINAYGRYLKKYDTDMKLIIIGDGDAKSSLENLVESLELEQNVKFLGRKNHGELIQYLSESMAFLIYTRQDNNMISISESLACCTPVITTSIPYNSRTVSLKKLGIVKDDWDEDDLNEIAINNQMYVNNCLDNREFFDYKYKVKQFLQFIKE